MKTLLPVSLVLLLGIVAESCAGDPALFVSVAVPANNSERRIEYRDRATHFHVVISNVSDKPQKIWREWCSWGYYGLSFVFTDEGGKKWVAKKQPRDWTKNAPDWWTLAPRESLVLDVYFGDSETWRGFPRPENGSRTITMQAVFQFEPDDESRKYGVWTGHIASKPEKVAFYHWREPGEGHFPQSSAQHEHTR